MKNINIGGFILDKGRTFIIAELSANHGGSLEIAIKTIEAAKKAGADAVKLQTYTADTLTINCSRPEFTISNGSLWDGQTFYDLYSSAYTPWEWQPILKKAADEMGLMLFSTPFDKTAVDFLEKMDVPAYKIASFEITDIPLIKYVASKGKPMLISTGVAEKADIEEAVTACRASGCNDIVLLKCTSAYPAPVNEANLRTIPNMTKTFNVSAGLSDHTTDNAVAVAAAVLGASVIEKHFILDKGVNSPDASFSATPAEFADMVKAVRTAESALGSVCYDLTPASAKGRAFSRSLYAVSDIKKGEIIKYTDIRSVRPSGGMHPRFLENIIGKKAVRDILRGEPMRSDMFEDK